MNTKETKQNLIQKHIELWNVDVMRSASIEHYYKTGKASGGFRVALMAMMDEYALAAMKEDRKDYAEKAEAIWCKHEEDGDTIYKETISSITDRPFPNLI